MIPDLPSPEQKIELPFLGEAGLSLYIKRDDLIHPHVSGNKWRKLAPILAEAQTREIKTLRSYGGAWSNHLLALAAAGAGMGFATSGVVRGEEVNNPVLELCREYGMELEFLNRERYRELRHQPGELETDGDTLIIPEGAACAEGRSGMKSLWEELHGSYDFVLDSVGSGTSVLGLHQNKPADSKVLGFMAVNDHSLARNLRPEGIEVFEQYTRGGFARMDEELVQSCREFEQLTGVQLDPVYTGKMWMALKDLVMEGYFPPNSRLLFIHSGGLSGWWSFSSFGN